MSRTWIGLGIALAITIGWFLAGGEDEPGAVPRIERSDPDRPVPVPRSGSQAGAPGARATRDAQSGDSSSGRIVDAAAALRQRAESDRAGGGDSAGAEPAPGLVAGGSGVAGGQDGGLQGGRSVSRDGVPSGADEPYDVNQLEDLLYQPLTDEELAQVEALEQAEEAAAESLQDYDVVISAVDRRGPAAFSKLQPGDVIVEYDGQPIRSREDLQRAVDRAAESRFAHTQMVIERDGKQQPVTIQRGDMRAVVSRR